MSWDDWLARQAERRERGGLRRRLSPRGPDDAVIDLAGNDYLGLSRHPDVTAAAAAATTTWGAGSGASRLVTGTLQLHADLEAALASYLGQPAALVFSTGYHANLSVVAALADRDCLVVSDAHIHASLIDAVRLSRADLRVVPHNDVDAVRDALAGAGGRRTLVLAESIYSVLGDEGRLVELAAACAEHGALLVVDEAHGLGVHGPGVVHRLGLAGLPHVVVTATLSKSLGSQGGAVLTTPAIVEHLVNRARPFIFDTALAPAPTAGALAALELLRSSPDLPGLVRRRVHDLAATLGVEPPAGAVLSVPMPSPAVALQAQADALAHGVRVGCFRPPSVPDGISRLRITINAGVGDEAWARATEVLVAVVKEHQ
ncbi:MULTISPECIES: 8-amino-7-oxononanoate synthase [unclassified Nocardioides]|uniref:8-amino-7-oxononanoate synthase n=1 Tax=unclassified Nocardioides TaxID=2615069 RepID=UPI0009F0A713|nr:MULTISPECIES: 8-amino-7-oxononanoate synthase [unclassified Nocardioides]GAW52418.1 8-amino-7-oxononanoate synthase [Nocardioides sp. PD653-B2]GAW56142.1 8-amino-7-oxononanoate synthase [Nocardioides sp. PD653]